ncbi:hypothetical protein H4I96_03066 [Botrytis cinerea]
MSWQNDSPYSRHEFSSKAATPPSSSFASNFFRRARRASLTRKFRKSVSFADPLEEESPQDNSSENSEVLYMADSKRPQRPQRPKPQRRTLSAMSNSSLATLGQNWDSGIDSDLDSEAEEVSWDIINKEIHEWQYVCRTGRPFWWSPEFKSTHSSDIQELAKVIAVQLLGACFTLAPEYLVPLTSTLASYNRKGGSKLPDSRMISSLRMHTQFRYSPCFGHQARGTSPIQPWDCGGYDGSSTFSSSPTCSGGATPLTITSEPARRQSRLQKAQRALNISEQSVSDCTAGSYRSDHSSNIDSIFGGKAGTSMGQKLREGHTIKCGKTSTAMHVSGADNQRHNPRHSKIGDQPEITPTVLADDANINTSKIYRGIRAPSGIRAACEGARSKEMEINTAPIWGSLQGSLPRRGSRNDESESESDATSSTLSTDARARRRRAQERGDIHSAGGDDSPHYNTPRSGAMTPATSMRSLTPMTPMTPLTSFIIPATPPETPAAPSLPVLRPMSPFFKEAGTMAAITSFLADARQPEHVMIPPDSFKDTGGYVSPNMIRTEHAAGAMFIQSRSSSQSPLEPLAGSYRGRRTSLLSEMCTPEDFNNDGTLKCNEEKQFHGPHLARASSSGTQIFRPGSDGIELDGMPVGPGKEFWDGPVDNTGKRRERTYL